MNVQWKITRLLCYPEEAQQAEVVFSVQWKCSGEDSVNEVVYKALVNGCTELKFDPSAPFTPYSQLTEDEIFKWCVGAGLRKDIVEARIADDIKKQVSPPFIVPPLPWSTL